MSDIQDVYNQIAHSFDKTRFSIWKGVREFLDSLPVDSLLGDIGCGNGKNMLYRQDIFVKGYDSCDKFVTICKDKGLNVTNGDVRSLKIRDEEYDNVICIAVIHHLKTKEERIKGLSELLRITKKRGQVLVYVWAWEQPEDSRRKFKKGDNLVSFGDGNDRFYHIYTGGELESELDEIKEIEFKVEKIFLELGNWVAVIKKL